MLDLLTEDLPGNQRRRTQRGESLQNGYDSDSEGVDSESETETPPKPKEDEDDMFASDAEEAPKGFDMDEFEKEQGLGKHDSERNLALQQEPEQLDEQETQEQHHYYNDAENFDGTRPQTKIDLKIEAFDLREEAEIGTFDKDLNYTRKDKSDSENNEDAWMSNIKSADIRKAHEALKKREAASRKLSSRLLEVLLQELIQLLEPAETPLEALSGLKPPKGKKNIDASKEALRKKTVFDLTGLCDELMSEQGVAQIYDMSREELMRAYKQETGTDFIARGTKRSLVEMESEEPQEAEDYGVAIWEFRWVGDDAINGPYSAYEMNYWVESYFANNVEVRKVGQTDFQHVSQVTM